MAFLNDITMQQLVTRLLAMAVLSVVIGCSVGGVAWLLGDRAPWRAGRGSLNPAAQLAWAGMAMAALFGRGWGRPVVLSPAGRHGRARIIAAVALGLVLPLLLVPAVAVASPFVLAVLPRGAGYAVLGFLDQFRVLTVGSVLLNALPVPGLVAGNLWRALLPVGERRFAGLETLGLAAVAVLLVLGWLPEAEGLRRALGG